MSDQPKSLPSGARLFWKTILWWDLLAALLAGGTLYVLWIVTEEFVGGKAFLVPAAGLSFALAGIVWVAGRHMADNLKDTDYGEILRAIDPKYEAVSLPYHVITLVAIVSGVWAGVGAMVEPAAEATWLRAFLHAVALGLFVWITTGFISLVRLSREQARNSAEVHSLREQLEREQRSHRKARGGEATNS